MSIKVYAAGAPAQRGTRCWPAVHHMRLHLLAALLVAAAAAAVVAAVTFEYTSAAELRTLERRQAVEEATLFYEILDNQFTMLELDIIISAWNDDIYMHIADGNPRGDVWMLYFDNRPGFLSFANLVALLFMLPNGTMLNGMMWNADKTGVERPSPVFTQQITSMLLARGKADGLLWIPETESLVIVQTEHVLHKNLSGPPMGWVVYARSPFSVLSHRNVGHVVAPASVFEVAGMTCSESENQTHDTYLAIGTVIEDETGVPRISILLRGIRVDSPTIHQTTRYLIIICCCSLFVLLCLVAVLLELFVIRVLSTLSRKIVSVSSNMNNGERLKLTGKHELRNVTRAVNKLLVALEHRTQQTEHIMQNLYPREVLARIKRGQPCNVTYPDTSVLFADICNFTLWSSALEPSLVTQYLNGVFSRMDESVMSEGATKVSTIGDCYVVISGMLNNDTHCARTVANVALKFHRLCRNGVMAGSQQELQFRMGIASGPCNSAMVGLKKKFFEIWGPSVTLSQQIQESAAPGQLLCCDRTMSALGSGNGLFNFEAATALTDGTEKVTVWRICTGVNEDLSTECESERSMSSNGLLSIMADDNGIDYAVEGEHVSFAKKVTTSLRFGAIVSIVVLLAVSVAALIGFLFATFNSTTATLVRNRATADMGRVSSAIEASLLDLRLAAINYAAWVVAVDYILAADPNSPFWNTFFADGSMVRGDRMDGVVYFMHNGTVLNSMAYDAWSDSYRNVSPAEISVLWQQIQKSSSSLGLVHDPASGITRLAATFQVQWKPEDPIVGYVAFLHDVRAVLPAKAGLMHMCLGVLFNENQSPGSLRSLWHGDTGILLLAIRNQDLLADEMALFSGLCGIGVAVLVFVLGGSVLLMELIVFRGLSRLSRSIIEVTSTSSSKETVKLQGNEQLRSIARSINFLLRSRDEQHNKSVGIIQSLFPPHVFQSLQRGTLPSEHFEMTSILFCDLIGFKAWATATPPEAVAEFLSHFIEGLDAIAEKHGVIKIKTILDIYTRLKAKAKAEAVLCDATTFSLTKDTYSFGEPQVVLLKGKGELTVYELVSKHNT
eukprot:m51a1_g9233 putative family 3 adenylate cyclase (1068) ;mRNA; r:82297-87128